MAYWYLASVYSLELGKYCLPDTPAIVAMEPDIAVLMGSVLFRKRRSLERKSPILSHLVEDASTWRANIRQPAEKSAVPFVLSFTVFGHKRPLVLLVPKVTLSEFTAYYQK